MDRFHWAERHDGLITDDVSACGGPKQSVNSNTTARSGRLRTVRRGVSVVNGVPPSWRQAVRAVLLSLRRACRRVALDSTRLLLGEDPNSNVHLIHVIS